jgi:aminopeptidase N
MVGISLVAAAAAGAASLPRKGEPPLTAQTQRSGGPVDPDQANLRFDTADLSFEVLPDTEQLKAVAVESFTPKAPADRLVIDLDKNLGPSAIAVDGQKLPASAWSNPDGRLTIKLPRRYAAGERVTATIAYGGVPHVADNAPWDDGVVWSKTRDGRLWFATTSEGYGCDILWPCLDFPEGEPGKVALHITVPKGLKAPSNGVFKGVDTGLDGRETWNWEIKHPNTYAIALNVAPYEVISADYKSRFGNTIPMFYWYLPGEEDQA